MTKVKYKVRRVGSFILSKNEVDSQEICSGDSLKALRYGYGHIYIYT